MAGIPLKSCPASAIPERSAPILMVFAHSSETENATTSHRGYFFRNAAPSPCPVTMPIRAHMNCTAPISGHVMNAVQSRLVPSSAPAEEYVAIPEGSSSAAPVTTPGPIPARNRPNLDPLRVPACAPARAASFGERFTFGGLIALAAMQKLRIARTDRLRAPPRPRVDSVRRPHIIRSFS